MSAAKVAPTADALRTWINELSPALSRTVTTGVPTAVNSRIGAGVVNLLLGGRAMQRSAARSSGNFSHLVGAPGGDALQKAVALVERGDVMPVIGRTFSFSEGGEAISYHKTGRAAGKVVVVVQEADGL